MPVPYIRMIRLTDNDGFRVNAPIEGTRALRFLSFFRIFSYEFLSFSLIVALFPTLIVAHHAPHESRISVLWYLLFSVYLAPLCRQNWKIDWWYPISNFWLAITHFSLMIRWCKADIYKWKRFHYPFIISITLVKLDLPEIS